MIGVFVKQRKHGFGQTRQIPSSDAGLIGVRVSALMIDRTKAGARIVGLHKSAGAIVDRFARDRHIVCIHDAMNKANVHPL